MRKEEQKERREWKLKRLEKYKRTRTGKPQANLDRTQEEKNPREQKKKRHTRP